MSGNRERLIDFFTPARKAKTMDVEFFCLIVRLKTGAGSTSGNIYLTLLNHWCPQSPALGPFDSFRQFDSTCEDKNVSIECYAQRLRARLAAAEAQELWIFFISGGQNIGQQITWVRIILKSAFVWNSATCEKIGHPVRCIGGFNIL